MSIGVSRQKVPQVTGGKPLDANEMAGMYRNYEAIEASMSTAINKIRNTLIFASVGANSGVPRSTVEQFLRASGDLRDILNEIEGRLPDAP